VSHPAKTRQSEGLLDLLLCIQAAVRPVTTREIANMQSSRVSRATTLRRLNHLLASGQIRCVKLAAGRRGRVWEVGPPMTDEDLRRQQQAKARLERDLERERGRQKHMAGKASGGSESPQTNARNLPAGERDESTPRPAPVAEYAPRRDPLVAAFFGSVDLRSH